MGRDIRLDRELMDQIVFGMENQEYIFYLDLEERRVVPETGIEEDEPERFVALPEWQSVDGYNLMERFVASLRNPIYRERLRGILASGRGVFRQFKNALHERPDIERLWFGFKQQEMRSLVAEWINDLREQWGLERLSLDDDTDDTESLIESDFTFVDGDKEGAEFVRSIDRAAFGEGFPDRAPDLVDALYGLARRGLPAPGESGSEIVLARTPSGDTVGCLWGVRPERAVALVVVVQVYVHPEYRGLGLAIALLREYMQRCQRSGLNDVVLMMPGDTGELGMRLDPRAEREGVTLRLDVARWYRDQTGT
jgi:GNAT superfamily N-acetyltransferase